MEPEKFGFAVSKPLLYSTHGGGFFVAIEQHDMNTLAKAQPTIAEILTLVERGGKPTVNARDLHGFIENGDHFSTWMHNRIVQFEFIEGDDFVSFSGTTEKPSAGRPSKEYYLSLDMAKELSMVERNVKGKEARRYFIECERKLMVAPPKPLTREQALLAELAEIREGKVKTILADAFAPTAEYGSIAPNGLPRFGARRGTYTTTRSRLEEAESINRQLRELDALEAQAQGMLAL